MICFALENNDPQLLCMAEQELGVSCSVAHDLRELLELLVQERLTGFVVDKNLLDREARTAEMAWAFAGGAFGTVVDLRTQTAYEIVAEVREASLRHQRNRQQAEKEARKHLAQKIADPLGVMMINLGIVLEDQKLAKVTRIRIERILRGAELLKQLIEVPIERPDTLPVEPALPRPVLVRSTAAGAQS